MLMIPFKFFSLVTNNIFKFGNFFSIFWILRISSRGRCRSPQSSSWTLKKNFKNNKFPRVREENCIGILIHLHSFNEPKKISDLIHLHCVFTPIFSLPPPAIITHSWEFFKLRNPVHPYFHTLTKLSAADCKSLDACQIVKKFDTWKHIRYKCT